MEAVADRGRGGPRLRPHAGIRSRRMVAGEPHCRRRDQQDSRMNRDDNRPELRARDAGRPRPHPGPSGAGVADSGFSAAIISFVDAPSGRRRASSSHRHHLRDRLTHRNCAGPRRTRHHAGPRRKTRDDAVTALSDLGVATAITFGRTPRPRPRDRNQHLPRHRRSRSARRPTLSLASAGTGLPLGEVRRLSGSCESSGEASLGGKDFKESVQCGAERAPSPPCTSCRGER